MKPTRVARRRGIVRRVVESGLVEEIGLDLLALAGIAAIGSAAWDFSPMAFKTYVGVLFIGGSVALARTRRPPTGGVTTNAAG